MDNLNHLAQFMLLKKQNKKINMKKVLLLAVLFCTQFHFAQNNKSIFDRRHEIKFGAVKLLSGIIFEGTYEYIQTKDFTFGSSVLVNFDRQNDYPENFAITPFARFYFQESREFGAKGFFVEGFGKYSSGKYDYNSTNIPQKYSAASLGLSLGKKWINNSGFVFEALIGVGRTLGNSNVAPDASFRGDLFIGYRF
jgi:hypothetical protein